MTFRRSFLTLSLLALAIAPTILPARAKVLAEGKPSAGFYWQKVEGKNGTVSYMCRSKADSKLRKADACEKAGARKP